MSSPDAYRRGVARSRNCPVGGPLRVAMICYRLVTCDDSIVE